MHFIESAAGRCLTVLILAAALAGCEENFTYSPYQADVARLQLTRLHLDTIQQRSQAAFAPFKFAVTADTHVFYDPLVEGVRTLNQRPGLAFTLVAGDLTNNARKREFEFTHDILSRLQIPYLTVVGNHDALANGQPMYQDMFGPFNYTFVYNDVKFVMFNSNSWEFKNQAPDFTWLENALADVYLYSHGVVVAHIGPFDSRFSSTEEERFRGLLATYGVDYGVFAHEHEHRFPGNHYNDGVSYVVAGTIRDRGFLEFTVDGSGISWERITF